MSGIEYRLLTPAYVVRGVNTVSSIYLLHQSQIQAGQDVTEVHDDMTADSDGVGALVQLRLTLGQPSVP